MKTQEPKVIFSKNRITITELPKPTSLPYVKSKSTIGETLSDDSGRYTKSTKTTHTQVRKKCESPLGFWYWKTETVTNTLDSEPNPTVWYQEVILQTTKTQYTLIYPESQGSVMISTETRPWMIVSGYKSMSDHFIQDLYADLERIFTELKMSKAVVMKTSKLLWNWQTEYLKMSSQTLGQFKANLYLQIFGNSKGPREMTNSEKILAHGFDLKTSFRK